MKEEKEDTNNKYNIQQLRDFDFDFSEHTDPISVIFSGRRRQGKGVLSWEFLRNMDKHYKKIKKPIKRYFLFSQTAKYENEDWDFMDSKDIFDNLENLNEIVRIRQENGNKENVCIILDDFLAMAGSEGGKLVKNNANLEKIFSLGRHIGLICCILVQKNTMLSKLMRQNCDYMFYACMRSEDENYMIRRECLGLCKNKQQREEIFNSIYKEKFCFMAVENYKSGCTEIYDYVSKIVAPYPRQKWKANYLKVKDKRKTRSQKDKEKKEDDFNKLY